MNKEKLDIVIQEQKISKNVVIGTVLITVSAISIVGVLSVSALNILKERS